MTSFNIKEMMVPLSEYSTVFEEDTIADAITALGIYPSTRERVIHPIDFIKYGFVLWVLSLLLLWGVGVMGLYSFHGFPTGILETATKVLESTAH